ncbi:serine palmitoyltransferase small subunit A-like [Lineus longissimus]|uniref:serine palmitoyltransferase small subunit A-like n=1 Tax=Lineus longissimus TaxID=88925 RepID=UPI002B4F1E49
MELVNKICDFVSYWYLQYILCTALYMLEPWERRIFNSFLIAVIAMSLYTSYLFLPGHAVVLMNFIKYVLGMPEDKSRVDDVFYSEGVRETG